MFGTTAAQHGLDLGNNRKSYDFGRSSAQIEPDRRLQSGHDFIGIDIGVSSNLLNNTLCAASWA
jgi:hypothetical protein